MIDHALPDLCSPFLDALPISGVSIAVFSETGAQFTLSSSDEVAARIDELQFELGEGPQLLTAGTGEVTMIPDVLENVHRDWPMFAAAVSALPVRAIFSLPMKMGAVTVGVATLYRDLPGALSENEQISGIAIASAIASAAVERATVSATDDATTETATAPALRREVHQATGMILVQLETTATIAYSRLRAYAFANGRTVQSVAHDVVTRALVFDDETP